MNLMIDTMVYDHQNIFGGFGEITTLKGKEITRQSLIDNDIDVLIIRSKTQINQTLLEQTSVKFVGSTVAGLDHIDLEYLNQNNLGFSQAAGSNANSVVEYVMSALVNLADEKQFDLSQKTLGIIGVGNVGSRLDKQAQLMGIQTLLNDPPRQTLENLSNFVDLNTALQADIVSFHTPITKIGVYPSYHLLNANNAHFIKPNAIVINTARGGVIDESVWLHIPTLTNIIDCWENEPNINQNLRKTTYWATPHIAGHSIDAKFMGSYMVYQDLCQFLKIMPNTTLKNNLQVETTLCDKLNFKTRLNCIYDFSKDCAYTENPDDFEHYRQNYPKRYEWYHFK